MGDSFKIRLNLQGSLLDNTKIRPIIQRVVSEEMLIVGELVVGQLQKSTPVGVTSNMRGGWFHEGVQILNNTPTLQISNKAEYVESVDQGSKAHMPPVEPLINWVKKKLGISDKAIAVKRSTNKKSSGSRSSTPQSPAAKVAWAIAIRMSKHATPGKHFIQKALDLVFPKVTAYLQATLGESLVRGFDAGGQSREESR